MLYTLHASPLGELLLTGERVGERLLLASVTAPGQRGAPFPERSWVRDDAAFVPVTLQLDAYFAGTLKEFDVEFAATTGTAFQREVWAALEALPYGETTTYGKLNAELGGSPARARAIGAAIGANPLLIVRPCHRVVGSDGSLTGFAAGLPAKELLLTLEGCR